MTAMTTLEICGAFGGNSGELRLKVPSMRRSQEQETFFASESPIGSRRGLNVDWGDVCGCGENVLRGPHQLSTNVRNQVIVQD